MASSLVTGNLIKADGTQGGYGCTDAAVPVNAILTGAIPSVAAIDPTTVAWVARGRANDIAGSDGAAITTFTGLETSPRTWTGTGTLKTGILNGKKVLRANGTSNTFTTPTGGELLTGDFYFGVLCRFSSLTGHQDVFSSGDAASGKRRSAHKFDDQLMYFVGEFADARSPFVITTGVWYFLEVSVVGGFITVRVNGATVAAGFPTAALVAFTSTVMRLWQNPGGSEFFAGDTAEWFAIGSDLPPLTRVGLYVYLNTEYALSLPTAVAPLTAYQGAVVGGSSPILTGVGTSNSFTKPAAFSVNGGFAASVTNGEHMLTADASGTNVLSIWQKNPGGYAVLRCLTPAGYEAMAVGWAAPNLGPFGGPNGSGFWELSNFETGGWGDGRIVQTTGGTHALRTRYRDDTRAIEETDLTATEPSVGGPTPGLVRLTGRPPAATANNGVYATNITTGAGQCGTVTVIDATNSKCGIYRLENTTLTMISADVSFSLVQDAALTINVYTSGGQLVVQNKTGGSLNLTARFN